MKNLILILFSIVLIFPLYAFDKDSETPNISITKINAVKKKLLQKHEESQRFRIESGVERVSAVWWEKVEPLLKATKAALDVIK